MANSYTGKMFIADLTNREVKILPLDEKLKKDYFGCRGIAVKLLYDSVSSAIDPLGPENPLCFATGPLTGTPAMGSGGYFTAVGPLTGIYLDSGMKGHFSPTIKLAGFDAFMVTGKADSPVYLWICNGKVEIRDASHLWGKEAYEADDLLKEEIGMPDVHVAAIGPAGENLVKFACINCDKYRQAGRGGMGAVMGSKNLKAIAAKGDGSIELARPQEFLEGIVDLHKAIDEGAELLRREGTLWLLKSVNDWGMMPTRNFQYGVFDKMDRLNTDYSLQHCQKKNRGCYACSLMCSNEFTINSEKYGTFTMDGPEYETVALLGANCGFGSFEGTAALNITCDTLGMDTMSAGGILAFAMELFERGIITETDTGGRRLDWGNYDEMSGLLEDIAYKKGFGAILAEGTRKAAATIGNGAEYYAMQVKGMELPAYDPRGAIGMALAYATSDRGGCHLRAWTLFEEMFDAQGPMKALDYKGKAALVAARQNRKVVMDAMGICQEAGLLPGFVNVLSAAVGWEMENVYNDVYPGLLEDYSVEGGPKTGARVYTLSRVFNTKLGMSRKDDTLPERFFTEPLPGLDGTKTDPVNRETFESIIDEYYEIQGWDKEGKPTRETLEKYGLSEAIDDLF